MSVNDLTGDLESLARQAVLKLEQWKHAPFHSDVTVRVGDDVAERHAYALATSRLKKANDMELRQDLMEAIKHELDMAANGECPQCAHMASV